MAGMEKAAALACAVRAVETPLDMNSFSPMMPTSPLSMTNQIKFEDEPDLEDLLITVDEPESHVTTMDTFLTHRMITETSRGNWTPGHLKLGDVMKISFGRRDSLKTRTPL